MINVYLLLDRIDFTNLSSEDNERLAAGMMVVVKARQ